MKINIWWVCLLLYNNADIFSTSLEMFQTHSFIMPKATHVLDQQILIIKQYTRIMPQLYSP
jgi:hypothetical protein